MRNKLKSLWRWHRTLCRKCRRESDYPCRGCGEIALVKALAAENKRLRETINLLTVKKALQNAGTLDPADLPFQEVLDECKQ